MFTCSICGMSVESPVVYTLDPTHPICTACVHKFDDLLKNPDNEAFIIAFEYFSSFVKQEECDQNTKMALNYYLEQNREKYQNLCNNSPHENVVSFITKGNEEIENLQKEIQNIKTDKEKKEREELLDSLGLHSIVREYIPAKKRGYANRSHRINIEKIDDQTCFWYIGQKIYPEISDEEYSQIKNIVAKKEELEKEKKIK